MNIQNELMLEKVICHFKKYSKLTKEDYQKMIDDTKKEIIDSIKRSNS